MSEPASHRPDPSPPGSSSESSGSRRPVESSRSPVHSPAPSRRESRSRFPRITLGRLIAGFFALLTLIVVGIIATSALYATKTIFDLLGENRKLKQAITNLTQESQIGYAKVLSQERRDGTLITRLLFVETDRDDPTRRLLQKEFEIEGDVVHFDALIVKFNDQVVMDGKERALYLWRRVYGETQPPEQGFAIETPGEQPQRYAELFDALPVNQRNLFWSEIWELSNDPERLKSAGVTAIYGNAVYKKLRPGLIYIFKINATGGVYPETVPAL